MPVESFKAEIESLEHSGRGVAHIDGKTTFIEGALPGEEVMFHYLSQRKSYDEGKVAEVLKASPDRVEPRCPHFSICGACSLQHMSPQAQIEAKQQIMLDNFKHISKIQPESVLPALTATDWGYRRKARLGTKYVRKKEIMMVGFREKGSSLLTELTRCEVLHPSVGEQIIPLRDLIRGMKAYERIAQIEVAVGDDFTALVFRNLDELIEADLALLKQFGEKTNCHIYLQPKGPDTVSLLWPESSQLSYRLDAFDLEFLFGPTDFTQVNADINRSMVELALELLDLQPDDRVLDLFCGLGNFTLPLARKAAAVVGVEGDDTLVGQGRINATHNGINNVEFYGADLTQEPHQHPWFGSGFDKILLDPPRSGAYEVCQYLPTFGASRIVYVSCNPATLARDAGVLVEKGYRLISAGVMDMFPHTTHVESIALFEK